MVQVGFRLCLITDRHQTGGRALVPLIQEAAAAGLEAVQLREKDLPIRPLLALADEIRQITTKTGTRLLINGRIDIALAVGADGVHLPSDGLPVEVAKGLLRPGMVLGVSCHSAQEVIAAANAGADYAVLGPIYRTPSKERYGAPLGLAVLEDAIKRAPLPIFAIGGIRREDLEALFGAGVFGVALSRALLQAQDVREMVQGTQEEIRRRKSMPGRS